MAEKKKREQAEREQEINNLFDAVAMLTDEQIESVVFGLDPKDTSKMDVAGSSSRN